MLFLDVFTDLGNALAKKNFSTTKGENFSSTDSKKIKFGKEVYESVSEGAVDIVYYIN